MATACRSTSLVAPSRFTRGTTRTDRFPHLAAAFPSLPGSAIIDAELVHPEQDYRNSRYRRVARHQRLLQLVVIIYRWLKP